MSVFLARLSDKYTQYATDPNIQMKINKEPELYKIQPWEIQTAKAIIQGVKMKDVTPKNDKMAKAENVIPNPEAELEEAVAPFGTDESFDESQHSDIKDKEDYMAKKKAIQDLQMDPNTAKDEELKKEIMRRKAELDAEAKEKA